MQTMTQPEITTEQQIQTRPDTLVRVKNLTKHFAIHKGILKKTTSHIHAVDDISFEIARGESLGLVGESGCGKTTTGKLMVKLLEPTSGHIFFQGDQQEELDIANVKGKRLKTFRRHVQMIFQDPYESMNPRRTVSDIVGEPLAVQRMGGPMQRLIRVNELLEQVGLTPAYTFMFRYPHELSGGQRQRAAIARALSVNPSLVIADEPTSMLDVSIRTGIINLMTDLAKRLGVSYLFITHDLGAARYMCNRIAVMYLGKIVEMGETEQVLKNPLHPYTKALLSALPVPDPTYKRPPVNIIGGVTRPVDPPPRCRFYDRCPIRTEQCRTDPHPALEDKSNGHMAACYQV